MTGKYNYKLKTGIMKLSNYENKTSQRLNVKSLSFEINQTNQKALPL